MQLIPEWMNNIHPLIVHFPVALLVFAVIADFAGIIFKRSVWIKQSALALYTVGSLGAVAAYFSGKQAADLVNFPTESYPVISEHADLALYTMLFFVIYTVVRLVLTWKKWDSKTITVVVLFIISLGGLFLLQETAEHGGELVFKYGVGTAATLEQEEEKTEAPAPQADVPIAIEENGSWVFRPGSEAAQRFRRNFKLLKGDWDNLVLENATAPNGTPILQLRSTGEKQFIFTYGSELKNLQLSARVNLDGFKGSFSLVHHLNAAETYDFVTKTGADILLGRVEKGSRKVFDKGKNSEKGWLTLKAVSSSGHYRAYVDAELAAHGHAKDLAAGTAGFSFAGTGLLQISFIETVSLDKTEMKPMDINSSGDTHSHIH